MIREFGWKHGGIGATSLPMTLAMLCWANDVGDICSGVGMNDVVLVPGRIRHNERHVI